MAQKPTTAPEAESTAPAPAPQVISMTMEELQALLKNDREELLKSLPAFATAPAAPSGPRRLLRNADLQAAVSSPHVQTQEDVATLAATVGPVTHEQGFIPAVPEVISKKDFDANSTLIGKLTAMGYVVTLIGVEFDARWEPTEAKLMGDKIVQARVFLPDGSVPPEPPQAQALLDRLRNTDPQASRIFLKSWLNGRTPSGDRSIDEMMAQEDRNTELGRIRSTELDTVERGDFTRLDTTAAIHGAGFENQALAPLEA